MEAATITLMASIRSLEAILEAQLKTVGLMRIQLDNLLDQIGKTREELDKLNPDLQIIKKILT